MARRGVVRLALQTGLPITPMASWISSRLAENREGVLRFGRPIWTTVGEPIALPTGPDGGQAALRELTTEVTGAITLLAVDLRDRYPRRWTK